MRASLVWSTSDRGVIGYPEVSVGAVAYGCVGEGFVAFISFISSPYQWGMMILLFMAAADHASFHDPQTSMRTYRVSHGGA